MYKSIKKAGYWVIGVDLGATNVKMALVDGLGNVSYRKVFSTKKYKTKEQLIDALCFGIHKIRNQKPVKGIGIGAPGLIDYGRGVIHYFINIPGWKDVPLAKIIKDKTGIPVFIDNDVNVMAQGELIFGAGRGAKNILCVTLGSGVGGGIILDGHIYRGSSSGAGELGHTTINEDGSECRCGNKGCMETYVGNSYIVERYSARISKHKGIRTSGRVTPESICNLAEKGDRLALKIWKEVGGHLGTALANAVNLLNPERIIIGGGVSNAWRFLYPSIRDTIDKRAHKVCARTVKIVRAQLGDNAGIIGAGALARERLEHEFHECSGSRFKVQGCRVLEFGEFKSSGVKGIKRFNSLNSLTPKLPKLLNCLLIFSLCLCVSVVCCGFAVFSFAQEEKKSESLVVHGDEVEYFPDEKKIIGTGNVSVDYKGARLTTERIIFYPQDQTGSAEGNVRLNAPPVYGRGEKIDVVSKEEFRITDGYITTCDKDPPHYKLKTKKATVYLNDRVSIDGAALYANKIPLLYLPRYNYSVKDARSGFQVVPGKQKPWGFYTLTFTRFRLDENAEGNIRLDYRENWGEAEGLDYKYKLKDSGEGYLKSYYAHQRDRAKKEGEPTELERDRLTLRHRWQIDEDTLAVLDYNRFSDRDFRRDFLYREEFEKEANPATIASFISAKMRHTLSLILKKRVNRFENVTEKLPAINFDLKQQRLYESNFYYRNVFEFANLTNKFTAPTKLDDDVNRLDIFNELSYSNDLFGWLHIRPFAGIRQTYYSKDKQDSGGEGRRHLIRGVFSPGVQLSTNLYKVFHNMRHIITPTIDYSYISPPTVPSGNLLQFDRIDAISRRNKVELSLENKLQVKRNIDSKMQSVDLVRFITTVPYNLGLEDGNRWENLLLDLELLPSSKLRIESDANYNPKGRDFETVNLDLVADYTDTWSLGIGSRYQQNTRHELVMEWSKRLTDRLRFSIYERFSPKELSDGAKHINRLKEQQYLLGIDLHCWLAELTFTTSKDRGDSIFLVFRLKASPAIPTRLNTNYHRPKL